MYIACSQGHLDMAKWLFEVGAANDIRTKDSNSWTPMFAACRGGNLDVAKWLFEVGASDDIRTKDDHDRTPMYIACYQGHLDVVKWLSEVDASDHIRTTNDNGENPMWIACVSGHMDVVQWLILEGAANNDDGHVDRAVLQRNVEEQARPDLYSYFKLLVNEHATFTSVLKSLLLTATRLTGATTPFPGTVSKKHRSGLTSDPSDCPLALLCGHEESLLSLIADFAGVVRGRPLRNAREALAALNTTLNGGGDSERGPSPPVLMRPNDSRG
jgi:hypothetical protein